MGAVILLCPVMEVKYFVCPLLEALFFVCHRRLYTCDFPVIGASIHLCVQALGSIRLCIQAVEALYVCMSSQWRPYTFARPVSGGLIHLHVQAVEVLYVYASSQWRLQYVYVSRR